MKKKKGQVLVKTLLLRWHEQKKKSTDDWGGLRKMTCKLQYKSSKEDKKNEVLKLGKSEEKQ